MNKTVESFLQKNDFDIGSMDPNIFRVKSDSDINPILYRCRIPGQSEKKEVSISQILGYSYEMLDLSQNLVYNLSHFFDAEGPGYERRSLGMLDMEKDQYLETMKKVSRQDTIYVRECEENKYVITDNGLHRYNVLRFHYLNELSKLDPNDKEAIKKLQQKYTIPVEVQETDYVKTYSYFLLQKLVPGISIEADYDSNYNKTGKAVVKYHDKKKTVTDAELLNLLKTMINASKDIAAQNKDKFEFYAETLPTFKNFLEKNNIDLFSQEVTV